MPKLIIDNREIEVPANTKVIEAAERLGIIIPRFCFHPALGSAGACRVCAVAFKDGPVKGVQMSCMVNAQDGMVVSTTDKEAMDFRRYVIEWLMLNHPHDCPVCDEGGHCLLQDTTVSGGHGLRRFQGRKRTHRDQYLGPLVQHEMNRCIQCYRCARYYQEFTGYRDLGVMGIGSRVYFGRSAPGRLESPFSGNLIDVCPTGVYTDKPSRFKGRRWDFERAPSICLHCSLGCNLIVSARYRQIVRHEAGFNSDVNGYFICDRGRYGYAYAGTKDRPRHALVKGQARDMGEALNQAAAQLLQISNRFGPGSVAAIGSMRSSVETLSALNNACMKHQWAGPAMASTSRSAENLKTAVSRLKPELAVSLSEVSSVDTVVVMGCDPINEAPLLALSLRQVYRKGGRITVIDPRCVQMPLAFDHWAVHPSNLRRSVEQLIQAITTGNTQPTVDGNSEAIETDRLKVLANQLMTSKQALIICGTDIVTPGEINLAADLAETLHTADIKTKLFYTLVGANAFAAGLLNNDCLSIEQIIGQIESGAIRALVMLENDLWHQFPDRDRLLAALNRLELFILMDHVASPLNEKAHFFIPTQTIYEAGGHWVNQEGRLQFAQAGFSGGEPIEITGNQEHPPRVFDAHIPGADPEAAWRIVAKLANSLNDNNTLEPDQDLAEAIKGFHPAMGEMESGGTGQRIHLKAVAADPAGSDENGAQTEKVVAPEELTLLMVDWTFGTEPLSAQTPVLSEVENTPIASIHPHDIQRLGIEENETVTISTSTGRFTLPLIANSSMAPGVVIIPRHHLLDWQIFNDTRVIIDPSQIVMNS